jgi:hypothetical protein
MKNVLLTLLVVLMLVVSANAEWVSFSEKYGEWEYANGTYDSVSYDTDDGYAYCSISADIGDDGYVNVLSIWDYGYRWQGGGTSTAGVFKYKLSGGVRGSGQGTRLSGSAECSSGGDGEIYVDGQWSWAEGYGSISGNQGSASNDEYCSGGTNSIDHEQDDGYGLPVPGYSGFVDVDFSPDDWIEVSVSAGETEVYISLYAEAYAYADASGSGSILTSGAGLGSASLDIDFVED